MPRWKLVIVISALAGMLAGLLLFYAFSPTYKSEALVLVKRQSVPEELVPPVVTDDLGGRIAILQQAVLGQENLRPMLERLGLAKPDQNMDSLIDEVRANMSIEPAGMYGSTGVTAGKTTAHRGELEGFTVSYTASTPHDAQEICAALTELLLIQNLKARTESVKETIAFLNKEVDTVSRSLEALDKAPDPAPGSGARPTLALERDIHKKAYADMLSKLRQAQAAAVVDQDLEAEQLGEQMQLQIPADLPDSPIFPNHLLFAEEGFAAGFAIGIVLLLRRSFRRRTN